MSDFHMNEAEIAAALDRIPIRQRIVHSPAINGRRADLNPALCAAHYRQSYAESPARRRGWCVSWKPRQLCNYG